MENRTKRARFLRCLKRWEPLSLVIFNILLVGVFFVQTYIYFRGTKATEKSVGVAEQLRDHTFGQDEPILGIVDGPSIEGDRLKAGEKSLINVTFSNSGHSDAIYAWIEYWTCVMQKGPGRPKPEAYSGLGTVGRDNTQKIPKTVPMVKIWTEDEIRDVTSPTQMRFYFYGNFYCSNRKGPTLQFCQESFPSGENTISFKPCSD